MSGIKQGMSSMIQSTCESRPSFRRVRIGLALGATALTTTLVPEIALAQSSGASGYDDGTIIVTAQRREQALQDVPMTVTLLDQQTLANAGVSSVQDLQNVTSGFSLGRGGSSPQPAIRGITTIINGSYENNIAVYIDGLYVATPQALTIDLPNIENVQILKGPQGTLYGRNATGGA
ncbi:MAG: TonB-dependent receptor, partial [Burkholderiales bacterium]